jgi:hypothetical protein
MANIKDLIQSIESSDSSFDEKLAAINEMEETLVAMRSQEQEAIDDNVSLIVEAIKVMERKVEAQLEAAKAIVPEKGDKGEPGKEGRDGQPGRDGQDGRDGQNGNDGRDGADGVSVTDAKIDFDGSLVITLSTGREINVGEVVAPDLAEKIKVISTMSTNTAIADITGGTIDNTVIGSTTPAAGTFTEVAVTTATGESAFNENDTITGWLYSGNTFSVGGQESVPAGLFIGSAGTKMYVNGSSGDDVNEYTLGTAWDITTATFVTVFSTAAQDSAPSDLFFTPDGLSMYVVGDTNNTVFQYTLGTAWSVATAAYASKSFSVATQETNPTGLWFKSDGTAMYVVGAATDTIFQYTISTAWDVSTASYSGISYSVAAQESAPQQVNLSADGLKMWVLGTTGDDIWEYDLGTAWDVSTATPVNNFYVGFQEATPNGLFIDSTAPNRVYVIGSTSDSVYQYNTETNSLKLDTEKLYVDGVMSVNGNLVAGSNAYVDGTLVVQGTFNVSGTSNLNALNSTGTVAIGTGTGTVAHSFGASGTASGSTKTLNIGTLGLSGSTTNINIGSAVSGSLGTTTISAPTVNIGQLATQFAVTNTASAVNYVQVTGAATGGSPTISAQGSDTNVPIQISGKGPFGFVNFSVNGILRGQFGSSGAVELGLSATGGVGFRISAVTNQVNYLQAVGGIATNAPVLSALGSDTNISQVFQSKGTGAIDLAAGSSGVNISNGGTVTAITGTNIGSSYTSFPSVVISAPTTAGGVQATASVAGMISNNPVTVAAGGTGYTVGDTLTVVGGTSISGAATLTVNSVSGGVITAVFNLNFAGYTVLPTNPVSVTGGTGSGATFNLTYSLRSASGFTITNAGSGYVEQPTVTFSGGGGSGAAAYASVGSGTTVRSLGSTMSFNTPNGETFRVSDSGATASAYWNAIASGSNAILRGVGGASNVQVQSNSTGGILFGTNSGVAQLAVSHTASAVNYVQVTGNATGNAPTISVQGSDTNINFNLSSKGTGAAQVITGGGRQLAVLNTNSAVNYTTATGSSAGAAPVFSVAGTDTNIDLALTPKGTGNVRFGTYTANMALVVQGYIEIKDSGGTVRKLAVIA